MTTIDLSTTVDITAGTEEVWAILADYGRDPEWRSGVETMNPSEPGPARPGTSTLEILRFGGRTYRNGGIVDRVDPGRQVVWRTTSGADACGSRTVEPRDGGGSRLTLLLRVRPHGFERLLAPVLRRMLHRTLVADAARLRALVESSATVAAHDGAGQQRAA
jgi:hypothetical protein